MKLVDRRIEPKVLSALASARVVCILGARQAGKSTLVTSLTRSAYQAQMVTIDDPATRDFALEDPVGFIADMPRPLAIDEIQRAPGLLDAIKMMVDRDNDPGQYILTGSANLLHLRTVADTLPGRVRYLNLYPFSQGEIRGTNETFLANLCQGILPRLNDAPAGRLSYAKEVLSGGFPEAVLLDEPERLAFFSSYIDSIADRGLAGIAQPRDTARISDLFRLIAARSGSIQNVEALSRQLAVSAVTVKSDLALLESLFLISVLRPWSRNLGNRIIRSPKIFISDSGMLSAAIGLGHDSFADQFEQTAPAFETFVLGEIVKQNSWLERPGQVYYYRDASEREIDIVVELPGGDTIAIEVKSSSTVRPKDFRHLRFMRDKLGGKLKSGVILYTGQQTIPAGKCMAAVPVNALWSE